MSPFVEGVLLAGAVGGAVAYLAACGRRFILALRGGRGGGCGGACGCGGARDGASSTTRRVALDPPRRRV